MTDTAKTIIIFGRKGSSDGFELREFLQRHMIKYNWQEVETQTECLSAIGIDDVENVRFPVVILTDGTQLFHPSAYELAEKLGYINRPKLKEYDVSIYGAGPAGLSAAVYAASEGLKTIIIERNAIGGQAGTSSLIENYMGFPAGISGAELADRTSEQAVKFGAEIILMSEGTKATFSNGHIHVDLADGSQMRAKSNICATGVEYRRLNLEREEEFLGKGIYYGAGASEAPFCKGLTVHVIGGANSAGQAAMYFADYANKVVMLVRGNSFKGTMSQYLLSRVTEHPNIDIQFNTRVTELDGDTSLRRITLHNTQDDHYSTVDATRVFVAIGGSPNTDWAEQTNIITDEAGYLITGPDLLKAGKSPENWPLERQPYYLETNVPGSFAAGDVRHGSVKRAATAAGEGAMAITFVHRYLREDFDDIVTDS